MSKPKVVIMTTHWKRKELTTLVFSHYRNIKEVIKDEVDITLISAGSEGSESREIAERFGFVYGEVKNCPLNRKNNFMALMAKEFDPDYCIYVNSDTLFNPEYFVRVLSVGGKELEVFGILDLYNFDLQRRVMGYWSGFERNTMRFGEPIGTGRCYPRVVMEVCDWMPWKQDTEIMRGLDHCSRQKLKDFGVTFHGTFLELLNSVAVEIKTDVNIWPWSKVVHHKILHWPEAIEVLGKTKSCGIFSLSQFQEKMER
jgi:hypothetical protein